MPQVLIAILRTAIPAWWGTVVAWLLARDLITDAVAEDLRGWAVALVAAAVTVVTTVWYALARWVEPRLAGWLRRVLPGTLADLVATWVRRLLLGSAVAPVYPRGQIVSGTSTQVGNPYGVRPGRGE